MVCRRAIWLIALVLLGVLAAACAEPVVPEVIAPATATPVPEPTATPVPTVVDQPTPTARPFENEPGVTEDTIRVGVIYDSGVNPVADQMSSSAAEAVEAWAEAINTEEGLAGGRHVEVVRIETSPVLGDYAAAIDQACNSGLFALVGSTALFDGLGLDQLESPTCGLPDFPSMVFSTGHLASDVTTVSNPIMSNVWQAGWARYYAGAEPEAATSAATMYLELPVSIVNGERLIEAGTAQGIDFVSRQEIPFDTDFVPEAKALNGADAALLAWSSDGGRLVDLLGALDEEEVELDVVDCGIWCYSSTWVAAAGPLAEGVSVWLPTHPLEESDGVPEMLRYLFWHSVTSGGEADPTSVGILAWASALLFEEAVNQAVGTGTPEYDPDNLTRAGVISAANGITEWDARGLHGVANPAAGVPSACFVQLTHTDGEWQRVFPARRGQLDCAAENLVTLSITIGLDPSDEAPPAGEEDSPDDNDS